MEVLTVDKLPRPQKENSRQETTLPHHSSRPDTPPTYDFARRKAISQRKDRVIGLDKKFQTATWKAKSIIPIVSGTDRFLFLVHEC